MQADPGASLSHDDETSEELGRAQASRRVRLCVFVAVATWAVDVLSKVVAVEQLTDRPPVSLVGDVLTLRLTRNPGAAFSLATEATALLSVLSIAVLVAVLWLIRRVASPGWALALGLLFGGTAGNLTDRLLREPGPLRGHVVDFLELPHWPVFNLADSAIVLAAGLIILHSVRGVHLDGSRASRSS